MYNIFGVLTNHIFWWFLCKNHDFGMKHADVCWLKPDFVLKAILLVIRTHIFCWNCPMMFMSVHHPWRNHWFLLEPTINDYKSLYKSPWNHYITHHKSTSNHNQITIKSPLTHAFLMFFPNHHQDVELPNSGAARGELTSFFGWNIVKPWIIWG